MRNPQPARKTVSLPTTIAELHELLATVRTDGARVVLEHDGVPMAALIPFEDLIDLLRREFRPGDRATGIETLAEKLRDVPAEEIEREVAKAIAEVRDEDYPKLRRVGRTA